MPLTILSFFLLIFGAINLYTSNVSKKDKKKMTDFFEKEDEANSTRKKDLSDLTFLVPPVKLVNLLKELSEDIVFMNIYGSCVTILMDICADNGVFPEGSTVFVSQNDNGYEYKVKTGDSVDSQDTSYETEGYEDASYEDGSYEDNSYEDGSYEDGSYKDTSYESNSYGNDAYDENAHGTDAYGNDSYSETSYEPANQSGYNFEVDGSRNSHEATDNSLKRLVNLGGKTNTQLKLEYGAANLTELTAYDENFTNYIVYLNTLGEALMRSDRIQDATWVLEYAIGIGSDISFSYVNLASIYTQTERPEKIDELYKLAENINSLSKENIIQKLDEFVHS